MKNLTIFFIINNLIAFTQPACAQHSWPRNGKTNSIEFQGILVWPDSCKTDEQRLHLSQNWYYAKLGNKEISDEFNKRIHKKEKCQLLQLPLRTGMDFRRDENKVRITYSTKIVFTSFGIKYYLFNFIYSHYSEDWGILETLDNVVKKNDKALFLDEFHEKVRKSTSSW